MASLLWPFVCPDGKKVEADRSTAEAHDADPKAVTDVAADKATAEVAAAADAMLQGSGLASGRSGAVQLLSSRVGCVSDWAIAHAAGSALVRFLQRDPLTHGIGVG